MKKSSPSSSPGVPPQTLANIAAVSIGGSSDPSQDLMFYLALAVDAARRIEELGVDIEFDGRKLALEHTLQAYREAQYIRSKRMPPGYLDTGLITKHGRLAK